MKIPTTFIKDNKKYYFVEVCKNFIRYQTECGICECFGLHDLGMIKKRKKQREANKGGAIRIK